MTQQLTEALQGGGIPVEALLGYAVISSVPDAPVRHDVLTEAWKDACLPEDLTPDKRPALGVFRSACRSVETRRHSSADIGHRTEVKVDEVVRRKDYAAYQVTRLVRDSESEVIDHPKAMRVIWTPSTGVSVEPLEQSHYDALAGLETRIRQHYSDNLGTVTGAQVREMVARVLGGIGSIPLRSHGGVVFIPARPSVPDTLSAIRDVFEAIGIPGANFITLPMVNADYERRVLEHHYTMSAIDDIDLLIAEVSKHSRSQHTVRVDTMERIARKRGELARAHRTYKDLLSSELEAVSEKIDLLDDGIDYLATREVNT